MEDTGTGQADLLHAPIQDDPLASHILFQPAYADVLSSNFC